MALLEAEFVGAQLYTVRDYTTTAVGLQSTLDQIASIGYRKVQFSAVDAMNGEHPAVSPAKAKSLLDQFGLVCSATHRPYDSLLHRKNYEIDFHRDLGCGYAAIGSLPHGIIDNPQRLNEFFREFAELAAEYLQHGITLGLHNHDWDIATIIDQADQYPIQLELDVYWAIQAGIDLSTTMPRLNHKVKVIHIKDIPTPAEDGNPKCRFAAIGEGTLDWQKIISLALESGTKCFLVEQDLCPRDPFDCLRSSWNYLCL